MLLVGTCALMQQKYPGSDLHERIPLLHGETVEEEVMKPPPYCSGEHLSLCYFVTINVLKVCMHMYVCVYAYVYVYVYVCIP